MGKSITFGSRAASYESLTDANTTYIMVGPNVEGDGIGTTHSTAVEDVTLGNAFVYIQQNDLSNAATFTMLENEVASTLEISVTASTSGQFFYDSTHTVTIEAGNTFQWKAVAPSEAGTHTIKWSVIGCELRPASGAHTMSLLAAKSASSSFTAAGSTYYMHVNGERFLHTTEADATQKLQCTGTIYNQRVAIAGNTASANTTITSRKNSAAGNFSVVIDSTQTGTFEESDTAHSDTIAAGDAYNWKIVQDAGTGSTNFESISCQLITTDNKYILGGGGSGTGLQFNSVGAETAYFGVNCEMSFKGTTEAEIKVTPKILATVVHLGGYVGTNTRPAGATLDVTLRKDGVDSGLTLGWIASTGPVSGYVEDSSSAVSYAANTNAMSMKIAANAAASGQYRLNYFLAVVQVYPTVPMYHQRQQQRMAA